MFQNCLIFRTNRSFEILETTENILGRYLCPGRNENVFPQTILE